MSISGDDGDGSDGDGEDDLPPRTNLFDFVKPIDSTSKSSSTPSVSVDIDMEKNTYFSNRTFILYGNGKILVTGKDQMLEFNGNGSTVLHY